MNYTDIDQWIDYIQLIETHEPVLGGFEGATNRPTRQLADRTKWLQNRLRIPVFGNVTLNVNQSGNDATGNLTNPFRQPQAALDYAVKYLDFRTSSQLTILI